MAKTRRRFTAEFKSKVALDSIKESKTMAELTQKYGVHSTQIKEWKEELLKGITKVLILAVNQNQTPNRQKKKKVDFTRKLAS